jgi:hypothetical protein
MDGNPPLHSPSWITQEEWTSSMWISSKKSFPEACLAKLTSGDFRNTSPFVAWRYGDIIAIITDSLSEEDQLVVKEHRSWQDLMTEIRKKVMDPKSSPSLRRLMSSIQPLPRSMETLNGSFISTVSPQNIQFDFLWGMVYLNLKVGFMSKEQD